MNTPRCILIADDHSNIVTILKQRLEGAGYAVMPACDGEDVLRATEQRLPDLYLLDIMMPKLNGYEVCTRLRLNPRTAHIPIILMSGNASEVARFTNWAVELKIASWLPKPFRTEELLESIHQALAHQRSRHGPDR